MNDHGSDERVQSMCKFILGDDNNFQNKFQQVKCEYTGHTVRVPNPGLTWDHQIATFQNVKAFSKEPSQFRPQDQGWKTTRANAGLVSIN